MLIGAGLGAGTALLTGNDPVKSAAIGGAMGGVGSQLSSNPLTSQGLQSASQSTMPSHLMQTGAEQATNNAYANGFFGNIGDTMGEGFDYINDTTGMENRDWTQLALMQGINSMQPDPKQPIQHAPVNISRTQVQPLNGGNLLTSNPRIKKLQMQGLI